MRDGHFFKVIITLLAGFVLFFWVGCEADYDDLQVQEPEYSWLGTWSTAVQLVEPRNMPPEPGLSGNTLRQVVRTSAGGDEIRLSLSNLFGSEPVSINAVHVAASAGGGSIDPDTDTPVLFNGGSSVTIPPGEEAFSDSFSFSLEPLQEVAITMYIDDVSSDITGHPGSRTTSYIQAGNAVSESDLSSAVTAERWYLINAIDVMAPKSHASIAILGNSITDGRGSGTDKQNRWPDILANRLQAEESTKHVSVLNQGIGGNCVLRECLGPAAIDRFERDVLDQPGVRWAISYIGVNDIGGLEDAEHADNVVRDLIFAYMQMAVEAHNHGILFYGATITPFGDSFYDTPVSENARQQVNEWIRESGIFDAVIDLDAVLRDPDHPTRLLSEADTGDHLHPNEKGYEIMGEAIDISLFLDKEE